MTKLVYSFGGGTADGDAKQRELLGGKGANLAEMSKIGVPVPPGFTITTEVCTEFYKLGQKYPDSLAAQVDEALKKVEAIVGMKFNDAANPLLVSVRSGARASMPGMMDTVLNLGLNDETVKGLIAKSKDERFAYDSYRRFVMMYANVVMGIEKELFEHIITKKKKDLGGVQDTDLSAADWKTMVGQFKALVKKETGKDFPENPRDQLWGAVGAVFESWNKPRAVTYRRLNEIPDWWGTAVNVQAMVFGNMGNDCATGVAFTRDPATGENALFGEYLINAQGEDVVAGIRTPQQVTIHGKLANQAKEPSMEETMPEMYRQFCEVVSKLEKHYRDMQDLEFTIQQGKLWLLQTRTGKRSAKAAITIAVQMVNEKMITKEEAILRVDARALDQLLHPALIPSERAKAKVLTKGLPASPGATSGQVTLTADEAEKEAGSGKAVILVREETNPDDIHGMHSAKGILTARGGMTSHAAVVARGMGRPCVSGAGAIHIDLAAGKFDVGGVSVKRGDWITIDGSTGELFLGKIATEDPKPTGDFGTFMAWVDEVRRMRIRTNADTPGDARTARNFGAEGIGLCRTEHMFFEADRISAVREMILAEDEAGRRKALAKILPMQRGDFEGIFREMKDLPVTIRLLDPPLHEFLPKEEKDQVEMAKTLGVSQEKVAQRVNSLFEFNPMLGHRGCRLGVTYPEIYEMQARAIMEAACGLVKKEGFTIVPEIMIPLVAVLAEFTFLKKRVDQVCKDVMAEMGVQVKYLVGTMIELPRAALTADAIAKEAEFFSFGTNDLTQTAMGLSRDDSGNFLTHYVDKGILEKDPFVSIDEDGVGQLIQIAADKGRASRPGIKLGICGEHGGDPASIYFCNKVGLDYVSCSPFRVPIARLAAAQATLLHGSKAANIVDR
ncbi:MAG: pyruvate, phosphate dikinase [Magnetococcales bacterium]|nr:pyruvate, phosphate dikinase [Magnetococcales bacterium]